MSLPKIIYVKEVQDREPGENYFIASGDVADISELKETIEVGVYELVRKANLINQIIIEEK